MIESIIAFLEKVVIPYGAFGVFLASFIEEIIVPIPSTLILLGAGFLFLDGIPFSFEFVSVLLFVVVIPAALGMTLGSLFVYGIAYQFGKPAIDRFGRYIGISWEAIEKAEKRFARNSVDEISLIVLRAFPIIPIVAVSTVCGLVRFPPIKYLVLTLIGSFIRAFILAIIGAEVGILYSEYGKVLESIESYVLVFFAIISLLTLFIVYSRKRNKSV